MSSATLSIDAIQQATAFLDTVQVPFDGTCRFIEYKSNGNHAQQRYADAQGRLAVLQSIPADADVWAPSASFVLMQADGYPDPDAHPMSATRTIRDATRLNCFWAECDVQEVADAKHHASQLDAAAAMFAFADAGHVPLPTTTSSSGRGVWFHWVLDVPASRADWQRVNDKLRDLLTRSPEATKLKVDPVVFEAARIMRVWGTVNSKNSKAAYCLGGLGDGARISLEAFEATIDTAISLLGVTVVRRISAGNSGVLVDPTLTLPIMREAFGTPEALAQIEGKTDAAVFPVLAAMHRQFNGDHDALVALHDFVARSTRGQRKVADGSLWPELQERWDKFKGEVTEGTLVATLGRFTPAMRSAKVAAMLAGASTEPTSRPKQSAGQEGDVEVIENNFGGVALDFVKPAEVDEKTQVALAVLTTQTEEEVSAGVAAKAIEAKEAAQDALILEANKAAVLANKAIIVYAQGIVRIQGTAGLNYYDYNNATELSRDDVETELRQTYGICSTSKRKPIEVAKDVITELDPKAVEECFVIAHKSTFAPGMPRILRSVNQVGLPLITANTYARPIIQSSWTEADAKLGAMFAAHVEFMYKGQLPAEQRVLLDYAATVIVSLTSGLAPVKMQWFPIITGSGGIGKSFWVKIIGAIADSGYGTGHAYIEATPADLVSEFSGWLQGKLFVTLNELTDTSAKSGAVTKSLKRFLTEEETALRNMREKSKQHAIPANFIGLSNEERPLWYGEDDRRTWSTKPPYSMDIESCTVEMNVQAKRMGYTGIDEYFDLFKSIRKNPGALASIVNWAREWKVAPGFKTYALPAVSVHRAESLEAKESDELVALRLMLEKGDVVGVDDDLIIYRDLRTGMINAKGGKNRWTPHEGEFRDALVKMGFVNHGQTRELYQHSGHEDGHQTSIGTHKDSAAYKQVMALDPQGNPPSKALQIARAKRVALERYGVYGGVHAVATKATKETK